MSPWTRHACATLILAVGAQGCGGRNWKTTSTDQVGSEQKYGSRRLAGTSLTAASSINPEGDLEARLDMVARCEQESYVVTTYREHQEGWRERNPSPLGLYLGGLLVGGGAPLIFVTEGSIQTLSILGVIGGGVLIYSYIRSASGNPLEHRTRTVRKSGPKSWAGSSCADSQQRQASGRVPSPVTLTTPWGAKLTQTVNNKVARFQLNWRDSSVDPLAGNAEARLRSGWRLEARGYGPLELNIDDPTADAMVRALSADTGIDVTTGRDVELPVVSVTSFALQDATGQPIAAARAGARVKLSLTLKNEGRGSAYRVTAATRSGERSLHGLKFSFGRIGPGQVVTREVETTVPREHRADEAIVVLLFDEANRNAPADSAQKVKIVPAHRPSLGLSCTLSKGVDTRDASKLIVNVNTPVEVRCTLENKGDGPALGAQVTGRLGSEPAKTTPRQDLKPGEKARFDLLLRAPKNAQRGDQLPLILDALEDDFKEKAGSRFTLVVGMSNICPDRMTSADFQVRKRKLEEELKDDPELLEEYLIQLTACITD